ncbi:recombinase family protein [Shewanella algae]|uniref:recombinase family protein n=1 Tax=Shewanella algae TaxID=38313 RepID=UPI001AACF799|nr:recombinase family protein [Shewanella algae]QTE82722.1 recombinase family protein [Shewanella algae]
MASIKPKTKAISYIRFSTPKQAKGDSYRRQIEAARAYCAQNNLELDESILFDAGVSAFKGKNAYEGALSEFIKGVKQGDIPNNVTLIVESLDRISRMEPSKALTLFLDILNLGVTVVTLTNKYVYTPNGDIKQLIDSLFDMSRANNESSTKSYRLSALWERKKQEAYQGGIVTSTVPHWLKVVTDENGKRRFEVIEERADRVRKAFELLASGLGRTATVRILNEQGVLAPSGKPWARTTLARLITCGAPIGHYQPHVGNASNRVPVGELITDYYPSVVDEDMYWAVRGRTKALKGSNAVRKEKLNNLFSKIAKCSCCGAGMRYSNKGKETEVYLCCPSRIEGRGCKLPYMQYQQIEIVTLTVLAHSGLALIAPERSHSVNEIESKKGQLYEVQAQLDRVTDAITSIGLDERLAAKLQELRQHEAELKDWIKDAETLPEPMSPDKQVELLAKDSGQLETRQDLYRMFLSTNLDLLVGEDFIVINGVKVTRRFDKGMWYWRSETGLHIGFEMEGYERRLAGLKSQQQPKPRPKDERYAQLNKICEEAREEVRQMSIS